MRVPAPYLEGLRVRLEAVALGLGAPRALVKEACWGI